MATIGLDELYYATITEETEDGDETYAQPKKLAKAMTAELSVTTAEATLYADDGASEIVKEFQTGTISLGIDNLSPEVAAALLGAKVDEKGVLEYTGEDSGAPVAVGFRAKRSNGKYTYFWLYRVKFSVPSTSLATKGDSITFSTPTIEGTILCRNKADKDGRHPWRVEVTEGEEKAAEAIKSWFTTVYDPNAASEAA